MDLRGGVADVSKIRSVEFDRDGSDIVLVPMELGGIGDRLESLGYGEPERARFERMHMEIGNAGGGFSWQPVHVPELCGVGVDVQNVVQAEPGIPTAAQGAMKIAVPFTVP